jgi:iron-sulfur cluster assembly protein
MIQITPGAAKQIETVAAQEIGNLPVTGTAPFLRVQVIGGGCSGLTYKMKFDTEIDPAKDKVFEQHGVKLVTDSKSYLYLVGTELDFSGGLNGKGFVFSNPNAKKSCGCGTSFAV